MTTTNKTSASNIDNLWNLAAVAAGLRGGNAFSARVALGSALPCSTSTLSNIINAAAIIGNREGVEVARRNFELCIREL